MKVQPPNHYHYCFQPLWLILNNILRSAFAVSMRTKTTTNLAKYILGHLIKIHWKSSPYNVVNMLRLIRLGYCRCITLSNSLILIKLQIQYTVLLKGKGQSQSHSQYIILLCGWVACWLISNSDFMILQLNCYAMCIWIKCTTAPSVILGLVLCCSTVSPGGKLRFSTT